MKDNKFLLKTKKKVNPKKRFFVEDTIPNYSCKHTHKDAPDNAICEDCYSSSGNSEGFRSSKKSRSQTENPDIIYTKNCLKCTDKEFILMCGEHAKQWSEAIRKQTAEEIFLEIDMNAYEIDKDVRITKLDYFKIKKKYLGGEK